MDYSVVISHILNTINQNRVHIALKVTQRLFENSSFAQDETWVLRWFDNNVSVMFEGNLDMAIIMMDNFLKIRNLSGTIDNWIDDFCENFDEEIDDFIYTYDISEDPNFAERIATTFTLENIVSIMYDKLKETLLDNDTIWLEPV